MANLSTTMEPEFLEALEATMVSLVVWEAVDFLRAAVLWDLRVEAWEDLAVVDSPLAIMEEFLQDSLRATLVSPPATLASPLAAIRAPPATTMPNNPVPALVKPWSTNNSSPLPLPRIMKTWRNPSTW